MDTKVAVTQVAVGVREINRLLALNWIVLASQFVDHTARNASPSNPAPIQFVPYALMGYPADAISEAPIPGLVTAAPPQPQVSPLLPQAPIMGERPRREAPPAPAPAPQPVAAVEAPAEPSASDMIERSPQQRPAVPQSGNPILDAPGDEVLVGVRRRG